ncbi:MAG: hypothetical protein JXX14_09460 [Deltaproteobacteria bacterium]|nr:hypothetical protein [Deltaproteobacteria bacterium]
MPEKQANTALKTYGLGAGALLGYLWNKKFTAIGPFIGAGMQYQTVQISLSDSINHKEKWWRKGVNGGLLVLIPVSTAIQIHIRPAINLNVTQTIFKKKSNESVIYETPYLTGSLAAGIVFAF